MKKICFLLMLVGVLIGVVPISSEASSFDNQGVVLSIEDDNMIESKALTYDELIQEVMKNEKLTEAEAKEFIGVGEKKSVRATYRTYKYSVEVTSAYKPQVVFYCETSEWGNYRGILSLLNTSLNRGYNGISKQFSGTIYTNLENAACIYFELNGDFYNNGTTSMSGGVSVGVGEKTTVNFSVSSASNHFKYIYKADRYRLSR